MYSINPNTFMNAVVLTIVGMAVLTIGITILVAWMGLRGRVLSYLYMFSSLLGTFALVVVVLGLRGQKSDSRPWHIFLDMKYQAKYTSQGASVYFADGRSSRLPPENTIPFDGTDYIADAGQHANPNPEFLKDDKRFYNGIANPDAKNADGVPAKPKWEGGKLIGEGYYVNRIPAQAVEQAGGWEAMMKRGQVQFNRNCAGCHGTSGRGGAGDIAYGIVGAYGLSVPPANVLTPEIQSQADGQLFNTIVNGKGAMSGYGHQVKNTVDRWSIVAYMRELQFAYGNPLVK